MAYRVLAVGDTVGSPGLEYVRRQLRAIRRELNADFVCVNGENANVVGVTPRQVDGLLSAGADCVTLGNHTWTRWELQPYLDEEPRVLRPANFAPQCPGRGMASFDSPAGPVTVINLIGRFTLDPNTDNPFLTADALLEGAEAKMIAVDFHAEATSEKAALAWMLAGKVTAVIGTHTHVQTNDARVLPGGTAFLTDAGMVGANDSILGRDTEAVVRKFRTGMPQRLPVCEQNIRLDGAVVSYELATGRAVSIQPISRMYNGEAVK